MPTFSLAVKRLLFGGLVFFLILPPLQARFHLITLQSLSGYFTLSAHPKLTWEGLVENTYQPALERSLEDRIGFREGFVRLRNQLSLSLFHVARSSDLVVGRNLVLFQPGPIKSYRGEDFLGEEEIRFQVRRLNKVKEELAKRNIPLLFVLAPNKARYQPEDLPDYYKGDIDKPSNYERFVYHMQAQEIPVFDANAIFTQWKDTVRYPLFPKGGTHWSAFGAALIADTLFRRIEQLGRFDLPNFNQSAKPLVLTDSLQKTDTDLSSALNLILPYQSYPSAYPVITFDSLHSGQQRPNLLIVGDSFTWQLMLFSPFLQTLFAPESRFWYYNNKVYFFNNEYTEEGHNPHQLSLDQEINTRQFILLLITEHNLVEREFGFIDDLYHLYFPYTEKDLEQIRLLEDQLRKQPQNEQRLWQEEYEGKRDLVDVLHQEAIRQYDRTRD